MKLKLAVQFFVVASFSLLFLTCNNEPKKPKTETQQPAAYKQVSPNFNADSAYYYVKTQVDFGPRVTNSAPHKKCGDWLVKELKKYTDNVIEQKTIITHYDGTKLNVRNIIAEINPRATKRILLAAHWDSRDRADKDVVNQDKPILGANDGASGVGVLMEIARIVKSNPVNIGIDIVLFDAEDLGNNLNANSYCLGSQFWSANLHHPNYKADFGILLDMVGRTNVVFGWEANSFRNAKPILEKVWGTAHNLNYGKHFGYIQLGGIDDDHVYMNKAGIPSIDIIDFDANGNFPEHHHTHNDNMNVIDRNTLKVVGQTVLEVIYTYQ
ncbi:MAG: M28 family peptidase [Bacteroidia bacterium]|jgi:Zn-dependent M28 family amino/carboxypeptidase|nr:M28 family peptidase [Bacteroidia bacterium]